MKLIYTVIGYLKLKKCKADMKEKISYTNKPQYKHDCNHCIYLYTVIVKSITKTLYFDIYTCKQQGAAFYLARDSDEPHTYVCGQEGTLLWLGQTFSRTDPYNFLIDAAFKYAKRPYPTYKQAHKWMHDPFPSKYHHSLKH